MKRCQCRFRIEVKKEDEDKVFKSCWCSRGCQYCAENNLYGTGWYFKAKSKVI